MTGATTGAIEEVLEGQEWHGAGTRIEGVSAGGMRVVKRQQEVEEGLCYLRASGRSSNNTEVGGRRRCRCYREDLLKGDSLGWSGYRRRASTQQGDAYGEETSRG